MKILEQIDYYKIREEVSRYCISEEGKTALLKREPLSNKKEIEHLKNCSREWVTFISASTSLPFGLWEPVGNLFSIIKTTGASLTLEQLFHLGQFCNAVNKMMGFLPIGFSSAADFNGVSGKHFSDSNRYVTSNAIPSGCQGVFMTAGSPIFSEASKLESLSDASLVIFRIVTQDGELRDLPEIAAIRKEIASLNQKIRTIMHGYATDQKYVSALESNVPVLKNGRQVLAVKAGQQNRISGIVHEVSGTGKTVFIEPEEAVFCTNELIEKEYELQEEIKKVLLKATTDLQPSIPAFKNNLPIMEFLDCTYAAAKYGVKNNCVYALPCEKSGKQGGEKSDTADRRGYGGEKSVEAEKTSNEEPPYLRQARHPLLGEKAVPIDIRFMGGKRILIITGPNTGGKTVSLKTFALLSMMNQAGFPVPAEEGTRLPIFKNIFADIGDEQSLDQSLSTFSGHMKNIADACQNAGSHSLVLLDELGSGTDPQEGTAIAMAVLDHLIERKSFVLVTTHMGVLKNYGYTNPACINASVEFNSDTLTPSYRLLMGIPGESHALDIAAKSGLPKQISAKARSYIATEQTDVSALIKGLAEKHSELDSLVHEVEKNREQIEIKSQKILEREIELRKKEHDLKKGKERELDFYMRDARRKLENLVRELREGEITKEKTKGVKNFINELETNISKIENEIEEEEEIIRNDETELEKLKEQEKIRASHKKKKGRMKNSDALALATSFEKENSKNAQRHGNGEPPGKSASGWNSANKQTSLPKSGISKSGFDAPLGFEIGAEVEVGASKSKGVLVAKEKKDVWTVQFGSIKMSVREKDITLIAAPGQCVPLKPSVSIEISKSDEEADRPVFELRLLGMHTDEAIHALERQLDLCTIQNFPHFSIIHGKGDGILQQAVHDYLSHYNGVKDFSFAPPEDGGTGKTYVSLR